MDDYICKELTELEEDLHETAEMIGSAKNVADIIAMQKCLLNSAKILDILLKIQLCEWFERGKMYERVDEDEDEATN